MTKSEFQNLQSRAASSGATLKVFLRSEGVAYSTYNYWSKKLKAEAESLPIAPISIRHQEHKTDKENAMTGVELPGVTLAFPTVSRLISDAVQLNQVVANAALFYIYNVYFS